MSIEKNNSDLGRMIKYGILLIVRNPFVSFSMFFVVSVTLFVIGISTITGFISKNAVEDIIDKIDTAVYFKIGTEESLILELKDRVEDLPQVREVVYVSQDQAFEEYKERHRNDQELLESLNILDTNPLRARFSIFVWDVDRLDYVARYIEDFDRRSDHPTLIVDDIDLYKNKEIIDRLVSIVKTIKTFALTIVFLFSFLSFLIIFNTVRLIIYLSREEIEVMRLIGASDSYIRTPFLVNVSIISILSSVLAMLVLFPIILYISPFINTLFNIQNLFSNYILLSAVLFTLLLLIGIILSVASAWFSTAKYLKN